MIISNRGLIIFVISCIVLYLLVLLDTLLNHSQLYFIKTLNVITSFSLLFYWVVKQFRIKKHYFEMWEIAVILFEILILISSWYAIILTDLPKWMTFIEYGFFLLHLMVLVLFLIFILTFKIKRLF